MPTAARSSRRPEVTFMRAVRFAARHVLGAGARGLFISSIAPHRRRHTWVRSNTWAMPYETSEVAFGPRGELIKLVE